MGTLHVYERKTFKYRAGWAQGDNWDYVCTAKQLSGRVLHEPDSYDDGGTHTYRVIAPRSHKHKDLSKAIADSAGGSNCQHEHDCCGCATTLATVRRVSNREYVVRAHVYYNL
jgi:hypothetical protein